MIESPTDAVNQIRQQETPLAAQQKGDLDSNDAVVSPEVIGREAVPPQAAVSGTSLDETMRDNVEQLEVLFADVNDPPAQTEQTVMEPDHAEDASIDLTHIDAAGAVAEVGLLHRTVHEGQPPMLTRVYFGAVIAMAAYWYVDSLVRRDFVKQALRRNAMGIFLHQHRQLLLQGAQTVQSGLEQFPQQEHQLRLHALMRYARRSRQQIDDV